MTSSPEGFPPQDLRSFLELCAGEWLALRSHFDLSLVESGEAAEVPAAGSEASSSATAGSATAHSPEAGSSGDTNTAGTSTAAADTATTDADTANADTATAPDDGLPDFAAMLAQARAGVEEAPSEEAWHSSERAELQVAFLAPQQADQLGGLRVTPPQGPSRELHFRGDGSFGSAPDAAEGRWQLWPDGSVELSVEAPGRLLRERIWFTQPNLRLRSSVEHLEGGQPGRARFSSEIRRVRKAAA